MLDQNPFAGPTSLSARHVKHLCELFSKYQRIFLLAFPSNDEILLPFDSFKGYFDLRYYAGQD